MQTFREVVRFKANYWRKIVVETIRKNDAPEILKYSLPLLVLQTNI